MTDRAPIEIRSATIAEVDYPDRTLSLIVAPYNEWTPVEHRGRFIEESIAPGAFGAVRNRARRFLVNMDHDPKQWLGTVLDIDQDNPTGLQATVKIRRSPAGDQALNDAADDLLGASIGMAVGPGGQSMEGSRRLITKAFLDHIALTPTPAYVGAKVLEVRHTAPVVIRAVTTPTPNMDAILAERRIREYGSSLT